MQLHQITPTTKQKNRKRIGRGGKRGTYSGRGLKGQKSRSGANLRPGWRDLIKQAPKKRGFKFSGIYKKPAIVNIADLDLLFKSNDIIAPKTLIEKDLVLKNKGRIPEVKILGKCETKKKLIIKDCLISSSARSKIEKAGGSVSR